jgi:6-phosphogluconolactonase
LYVVNQGSDTLSEFSVVPAKLQSVSGSPLTLDANLVPAAVTVSRQNTFVYVGGAGAILCYSIGTGGALTQVVAGGATASANFVSLDTSPDGKWLLALDRLNNLVSVYAINSGTGALALNLSLQYRAPGTGVLNASALRISPNAGVVMVALGTGGDAVFTFDTIKGVLTAAPGLAPAGYSDNALAFDANSAYVYVARGSVIGGANGLASYAVDISGGLTPVESLAPGGSAPFSVALDSTGAYAYVGDRGLAANAKTSTIAGYTVAAGKLIPLPDSPFLAGARVTALTLDQSGKFLIAVASGGTTDVTLYGLDALSPGKLNALSTSPSGLTPIAVASTH